MNTIQNRAAISPWMSRYTPPKQVFKNEKIMVKMQLDIPFAYKLRNELAKRNVKISDSLDLERVADEVCQYVLKK